MAGISLPSSDSSRLTVLPAQGALLLQLAALQLAALRQLGGCSSDRQSLEPAGLHITGHKCQRLGRLGSQLQHSNHWGGGLEQQPGCP